MWLTSLADRDSMPCVERAGDWDPATAASTLQWWADAGIDLLVEETPRDWLKPKAKSAPQPDATAAEEPLPTQLPLFEGWLQSSTTLPYASPNARRICPAGDPASGLMILAAMPEAEDCDSGFLIAGARGRLFDRMLAAIGRDRQSIYLAALSCLRSPDGRLNDSAATKCASLARHHIGLAAPRALLILGDAASKALLGLAVAQARGRWHEIATHGGPVKALVTLSPDYLLSHASAKAYAWADLLMLAEELNA